MPTVFKYREQVLAGLAQHGLRPTPATAPARVREALLDLYKYEIKVLRAQVVDGRIERGAYAGRVLTLRKRYWLLSLPVAEWVGSA